MSISDTQVFIALVVALIPGILAIRLSTELYKQRLGTGCTRDWEQGDWLY